MRSASIFLLAMWTAGVLAGCATSVPSTTTTVEVTRMPIAAPDTTVTTTSAASVPDIDDVEPRLLAANIKFGQIESDGDCELPEDAVERHIAFAFGHAGVPAPDNIIVRMDEPSSLCEPKDDGGFVHLGKFAVTMWWKPESISGGQLFLAQSIMEDIKKMSAILP